MAEWSLGDRKDSYVSGYPQFAHFISESPKTLHLRSFGALSIRVLLLMQHDLALKEKELLMLEEQAAQQSRLDGEDHKMGDFAYLMKTGGEKVQKHFCEAQTMLKEYCRLP